MSVIFGIRQPFGHVTQQEELLRLAATTEHYASDGSFVHADGRIGMGFQPFHTTERSRLESQPTVDSHGNMLILDGRLDNHEDLRRALEITNREISDSALILEAFSLWGEHCFSRLVGDWALALWSGVDQTLYLGRDHAGTRTLFFQDVGGRLRWSTYLETFFPQATPHALDPEYAASFLGGLPIRNLTPYKGIRAVPPAHYLIVRENTIAAQPHWNWMVDGKIQYNSDAEYEKHFLALFTASVRRRTIPGAPILAQLSGGMDSTAIVCMSDHVRTSQVPPAALLDTLSYYDKTEPNWNEQPYFSIVENKRRKVGIHIESSFMDRSFEPLDPARGGCLFPGADSSIVEKEHSLQGKLGDGGYRVILSGIGGDELLGGVPTPLPELADHLVSSKLKLLLRRATEWCLVDRTPLPHMLASTATFVIDLYRQPHMDVGQLPPWLNPNLRKLCSKLTRRDITSGRRIGLSPVAITNGLVWWAILETQPHLTPLLTTRHEYRYPYLDRDLVDFLFRIPREQLARPGRRRSLMRRALKELVPIEILERRRKAFLIHGPLASIQRHKDRIDALFARSLSADYGFVDPARVRAAIAVVARGQEIGQWQALMKAIAFEVWLRGQPSFS